MGEFYDFDMVLLCGCKIFENKLAAKKCAIIYISLKKIRLFCAASPEFITGPILTILGFK